MENATVWLAIGALVFAFIIFEVHCASKNLKVDLKPIPSGSKFYLWINEQAEGPMTASDVTTKLRGGSVSLRTLCMWDGGEWCELDGVLWKIRNAAAHEAAPPAIAPTASAPVADEYFTAVDGTVQGPFTLGQMQSMWSAGRLNLRTQFMKGEAGAWEAMSVLLPLLEPVPTVRGERSGPEQVVTTRKSRGLFVVLGLIFGSIGLHNFYAGFVGKGVVQLVVTLMFCWTLVVPLVIWLWAVSDVISTNADAQGVKMA